MFRLKPRRREKPADELLDEIARLSERNREAADPATEREILRLRHIAGIRLMDGAPADPAFPEPAFDRLPEADGLPEIAPAELDPELLRAGILRDGCLLVRGLVPREAAVAFAEQHRRARSASASAATAGGTGLVRGVRARPALQRRSTTARGSRRAAACSPSTRRS